MVVVQGELSRGNYLRRGGIGGAKSLGENSSEGIFREFLVLRVIVRGAVVQAGIVIELFSTPMFLK